MAYAAYPSQQSYYPSQQYAAAPQPPPQSVPVPVARPPPNAYTPGTKLTVGKHLVVIERYLSEGGFAHVYVVQTREAAAPAGTSYRAVLKRVACADREHLANMQVEVDTMKKLKGFTQIVTYIDSHASALPAGGYEVFLLMEYCEGGGLIDLMNSRLQTRLAEPEILKIFSDAAQGIACMHYLRPPLLHRDLKVENILIHSASLFKLADFGSAVSPARKPPANAAEAQRVLEDVEKHTTLFYRSPEMLDPFRRIPIDEKSDIWALGVLLYKLMYYTTPFEAPNAGPAEIALGISNVRYSFPSWPAYSPRLKGIVKKCLRERKEDRPTIYEVVREVCEIRGRPVPFEDIYAGREEDEEAREEKRKAKEAREKVEAALLEPEQEVIVPMRRGRPSRTPDPPTKAAGLAAPTSNIGKAPTPRYTSPDTAAQTMGSIDDTLGMDKFPSIREFALSADSGFDFGNGKKEKAPVQERLVEKLADDAFAQPAEEVDEEVRNMKPSEVAKRNGVYVKGADVATDMRPLPARNMSKSAPPVQTPVSAAPTQRAPPPTLQTQVGRGADKPEWNFSVVQPSPKRPQMVAMGTQTGLGPSPAPSPGASPRIPEEGGEWKFPVKDADGFVKPTRPASRASLQAPSPRMSTDEWGSSVPTAVTRPSAASMQRKESYSGKISPSPRVSLDAGGGRRPSIQEHRRKSSFGISIPSFLRRSSSSSQKGKDKDGAEEAKRSKRNSMQGEQRPEFEAVPIQPMRPTYSGRSNASARSEHIDNDVGFLEAIERDKTGESRVSRQNTGTFKQHHRKRSSMNIIGNKFGEAFKIFEGSKKEKERSPERKRTPYLDEAALRQMELEMEADEWRVESVEVPVEAKEQLEKVKSPPVTKPKPQSLPPIQTQVQGAAPSGTTLKRVPTQADRERAALVAGQQRRMQVAAARLSSPPQPLRPMQPLVHTTQQPPKSMQTVQAQRQTVTGPVRMVQPVQNAPAPRANPNDFPEERVYQSKYRSSTASLPTPQSRGLSTSQSMSAMSNIVRDPEPSTSAPAPADSKRMSIRERMNSYLTNATTGAPVRRTAEGYGPSVPESSPPIASSGAGVQRSRTISSKPREYESSQASGSVSRNKVAALHRIEDEVPLSPSEPWQATLSKSKPPPPSKPTGLKGKSRTFPMEDDMEADFKMRYPSVSGL
ncbi:Ark- serine/threonine protein kinase [Saitoella coloradoensis]